MKKLLIWGTGTLGMEALECALASKQFSRIDFLEPIQKKSRRIPIYMSVYQESDVNLFAFLRAYDEVIAASSDHELRNQMNRILRSYCIPQALLIHPAAVISPFAHIDKGCILLANTVIGAQVSIQEGSVVYPNVVLKQGCCLEKGVSIKDGSMLGLSVRIQKNAEIEAGCILNDQVVIADETIVKAGSIIEKDCPCLRKG